MRLKLAVVAALTLTGCATGPVGYLIDRDLDAAIVIADANNDPAGAACWRELKRHNAQPTAGIFSAWEHAKTRPLVEGCFRR